MKIKEFSAGYRIRAISVARGEVDTTQTMTVSNAVRFGNLQIANKLSSDNVTVAGYVVSASTFDASFGNQTFWIADEMNGEPTMQAYRAIPMKDEALYPVLVGDFVMINGPIER